MKDTHIFDTVDSYNKFNRNETLHPLISLVDLSKAAPRYQNRMQFGLYAIMLKDVKCGDIRYGKNNYDYQEGTLMFISPNQLIEVENNGDLYYPKGLVLCFHPDFLVGTSLLKKISKYNFFSYSLTEALHISERERHIIQDCFDKIDYELHQNIDKHSKTLIINYIEMLLNYCMRFYDRQFITRETPNKGIIEKFENLLTDYIHSEKLSVIGQPTVNYCAQELHLSPNYFGDLVKKETGKTPSEIIQQKIITLSKEKIHSENKSISEIAYDLGFKYPHHFNRIFKQKVGITPNEFRNSLN